MLIYRATDGTNAASITGSGSLTGTPWDTARTGVVLLTRPASRSALYTIIVDALVAAGWTRNDEDASVSPRLRSVFTSDGEDERTPGAIRLWTQDTNDRYFHFDVGVKRGPDVSAGVWGLAAEATAGTTYRVDFSTTVETLDVQILCNKDFFWMSTQNVAHTGAYRSVFCGNLKSYLFPSPTLVVASTNVDGTIVTTEDPVAAGYRLGDPIRLLRYDPAAPTLSFAALNTQITSVDSASKTITISIGASLLGDYPAGSLLGPSVASMARFTANNTEFVTSSAPLNFFSCLGANLLQGAAPWSSGAGTQLTRGHFAVRTDHAGTSAPEFGTGTTPNNRTLRFTCRTVAVGFADQESDGVVPGIITYSGTPVLYPHDYGRNDRYSVTPQDYVPLRFNHATSFFYMLGPTPGP